MARTSTYLNFPGTAEQAFLFYKSVFGTEFEMDFQRMGKAPPMPGGPEFSAAEKNLIMHVALPITGGHVIMATDVIESCGQSYKPGNSASINLEPDTREEATRLFTALSDGGVITMPLQDMFWGALFGACTDKFGVNWMVNCANH